MNLRKPALIAALSCGAIAAVAYYSPAFLASPSRAASNRDGARLVFAETTFDFGEVNEGEEVVHRFRFRNEGNAELRLDPIVVASVKASCALPDLLKVTVPGFKDEDVVTVTPGAANEVVTTLGTEGFAYPSFDGKFSQRIRIFSNDAATRTDLTLTGRVIPIIRRDPVDLSIGVLYKADGELPSHLPSIRLIPAKGEVVEITGVEATSPYLKPSVAREGDGFVVITALDPGIPTGHLDEAKIVVHTSHPKKPQVVIPVSGTIEQARKISLSPTVIDLGLVQPGEPASANVIFSRGELSNWKIVSAKARSDAAKADATLQRVGAGFQLALTVHAPASAWKRFAGEVELTTDLAHQPKIVIPFVGWTFSDAPHAAGQRDALGKFLADVLGYEQSTGAADVTRLLKAAGNEEALRVLRELARGVNFSAAVKAVGLIRAIDPVAAVDILQEIVRSDAEELVRDEALSEYFEVARDRSLQLLLEALQDKSPWVRGTAATLLGELGDPAAKVALLNATRDKNPDVAIAAVESLEQFFDPTAPKAKKSAEAK